MRSLSATLLLAVVAAGVLPGASPLAQSQAPDPLPIRRVVLYKSGVGYFEHLGRVRGDQAVTIDFTSGQLDDVLKSLTALDLDGGRVSGVSYNSDAGLDRRLGALRLPVGQDTTRAQLLGALRGARLDVRSGATRIAGRLLSVERIDRRSDGVSSSVDAVSIVTDAGEIHTVALDPGVSVRIVEADLNDEVGKYLAAVASIRDQDVRRLTITSTGRGDRDLFVSYVSEVPVWKATYRLVLAAPGETRAPLLQGWAVIDNTVGEDWENVQLSLVAGAPQAFIQEISKPYYVQRPVVPLPDRVLMSPQTHQGAISSSGPGAMAGTVTDTGGGQLPGAMVRVSRGGAGAVSTTTDGAGRFRLTGLTSGAYDVTVSLQGFQTQRASNVQVSAGMESVVNVTMQLAGRTQNITIDGTTTNPLFRGTDGFATLPRGGAGGRGGGSAGFAATGPPPPPARPEAIEEALRQQQVDASAAQLGDLFEYRIKEPVTIRKNQSALVPIVGADVKAEKVSLWNASSGSARALRAIWLTNATGLTLDGGSFSVIEGQAFAGEGLLEPLKAGERRLLSFAMDLALVVDAKGESVPTRVTRVQASRGLLIQQTEERQRRTYSARNEDAEPRTLVVEHPARAGWTVGGTTKPAESTPQWHRFQVTVAPKTTATFTVEETRPVQTQVSVNAVTDEQVSLFVRDSALSPALEAALREVLGRKAGIARLMGEAARRQSEIDQIGRDQERVRENMRALKGSSEERQLIQRYARQLDEQETRIETLRKELQTLTAELTAARDALARFIDGIQG